MIPVINANAKLKTVFTISVSAPITIANDAIETLALVTHKKIKSLSK